jgi:hypothetical protein
MMNFKNLLKGLVVAIAIFGVVSPAMAETITVTTTLNVADIASGNGWTGGVQNSPPFSPPFSVQLSAGDTFDFTILFALDQQLTINNLSFIWAFSYADLSTDVTGTGSLSLLNSTGAALYTSNLKTDTEGSAHFGQQFNNTDFTDLPTSVTFSGLHYVGTVDSYADTNVTKRTYSDPAFFFSADSYTTTAPVPVPAAIWLLGSGLLGLAGLRKKIKE